MPKLIRRVLLTVAIAAAPIFSFLLVQLVYAQEQPPDSALPSTPQIQESLCAGVNLDVTSNCSSGISNQDAANQINDLVADIINIFSWVVGVVSVIMIIVGGFRYITSAGDSSKVGGAKNTIMYALIGLVIVALAQTVVKFILSRVINV